MPNNSMLFISPRGGHNFTYAYADGIRRLFS